MILNALVDMNRTSKDLAYLTEPVRQKLGAAICPPLLGEAAALSVLTLSPGIEQTLMKGLRSAEAGGNLVVEPKYAEQLLSRLAAQSERMMKGNMLAVLPVLLCSPDLRRHLRSLSERVVPHMRILSMAEIPISVSLKAFGTVGL